MKKQSNQFIFSSKKKCKNSHHISIHWISAAQNTELPPPHRAYFYCISNNRVAKVKYAFISLDLRLNSGKILLNQIDSVWMSGNQIFRLQAYSQWTPFICTFPIHTDYFNIPWHILIKWLPAHPTEYDTLEHINIQSI